MRVAIIGAGPAALMAALAVERNGHEPVLYAVGGQPNVNPDMFLQRPLPGLKWIGHAEDVPDARIEYAKQGSARGYARKCYGSEDAVVSWENINWGESGLWWLDRVTNYLWGRYACTVNTRIVDGETAAWLAKEYGLVMSTIPAPAICQHPGQHLFGHVDTWLVRDVGEYDRRNGNELVYNGECGSGWFRYSKLRGIHTWEYALEPQTHFPNEICDEPVVLMGKKLTGNSCDCHPRIQRVGRWAQWQRGVLNHHAYEQATAILASAGLGKGA